MGCICEKDKKLDSKNVSQVEILENATKENSNKFDLSSQEIECKVIDVYDGDTITIAFVFCGTLWQKSLRIYGVDCPEIRTKNKEEKSKGYDAKKFVSDLLLGKIVRVVFCKKSDKYGRLLGSVFINNRNISELIIENNHGVEYFGGKKKKFEDS